MTIDNQLFDKQVYDRLVDLAKNRDSVLAVTPATTVTDGSATKAVGTDVTYAREDHAHGTTGITAQAVSAPWFGTPTGSRAMTTVYQNLTGKAIFVSVSAHKSTTDQLQAFADSNNPPTTQIAAQSQVVINNDFEIFFIVLQNNYYKVQFSAGGGTYDIWAEWN